MKGEGWSLRRRASSKMSLTTSWTERGALRVSSEIRCATGGKGVAIGAEVPLSVDPSRNRMGTTPANGLGNGRATGDNGLATGAKVPLSAAPPRGRAGSVSANGMGNGGFVPFGGGGLSVAWEAGLVAILAKARSTPS